MTGHRPEQSASPQVERRAHPPRARRWRWLLILLALFVLGGAGAAWWFLASPPQQEQASGRGGKGGRGSLGGPMPVVAAKIEAGDLDVVLNALGTVTPLNVVTVRTQIAGQLTQVAFREGQTVKKGDFLAEVDPRPYQHALDQAQGQLQRDQALLKNAQIDVVRYRTLLEQDSIAQQQLATQDSLVHQYEGTVKTDQALVESAKLNLAYCHITAPIGGRVGLRQVDQGNYVQTSDANGIVVITQLKPITVLFTLPEDNLPVILKRMNAGAVLPVTAFDRTQSTRLATGTLLTLDNQIDTSTGTVKMKAQFDNDDEILFPNQFVNVQLLVDTVHGAVIAPTAAVRHGVPGDFVYTIKPDETVAVTPVKLGPANGERIVITSGLNPGDLVVVDGADKLRDGAKVALPGAGKKDAAGGAASKPTGDGARNTGGFDSAVPANPVGGAKDSGVNDNAPGTPRGHRRNSNP
jgi:multidrug efflux system membrane fusion protein